MSNSLNGLGLKVHEDFEVTTYTTFCGIDFDGNKRIMSVSHSRIWKLCFAIEYILSCAEISGGSLEHIIGHFTWSALARREALSILHATYSFMHTYPENHKGPIWESVRQELMWARALLPALVASLDLEWSSRVTCTESSHLGFGVVECDLDSVMIEHCGRASEKWGFSCEGAIRAHVHSLAYGCSHPGGDLLPTWGETPFQDSVSTHVAYNSTGLSDGDAAPAGFKLPRGNFDEVPDSLLKGGRWIPVFRKRGEKHVSSGPWRSPPRSSPLPLLARRPCGCLASPSLCLLMRGFILGRTWSSHDCFHSKRSPPFPSALSCGPWSY